MSVGFFSNLQKKHPGGVFFVGGVLRNSLVFEEAELAEFGKTKASAFAAKELEAGSKM